MTVEQVSKMVEYNLAHPNDAPHKAMEHAYGCEMPPVLAEIYDKMVEDNVKNIEDDLYSHKREPGMGIDYWITQSTATESEPPPAAPPPSAPDTS